MKLVSIPANPVPEGAVSGMLKTRTACRSALRALRAGRPPRHGLRFPGPHRMDRKIFRDDRDLRSRGFAVAILDWRGQGLSQRALGDRYKGYVRNFAEFDFDLEVFMREVVLPDCPPPYFALAHSMGATIMIEPSPAASAGSTASFSRRRCWGSRSCSRRGLPAPCCGCCASAASAECTFRAASGVLDLRPFAGNILTSDPVRYARNAAILEAERALGLGGPTITWCDAAFRTMRTLSDPNFAMRIRQPMLIVAAGRDAIVSNSVIEDFAMHLRSGTHLVVVGSQHELLMEQDRYRSQLWAAFDEFVPGLTRPSARRSFARRVCRCRSGCCGAFSPRESRAPDRHATGRSQAWRP